MPSSEDPIAQVYNEFYPTDPNATHPPRDIMEMARRITQALEGEGVAEKPYAPILFPNSNENLTSNLPQYTRLDPTTRTEDDRIVEFDGPDGKPTLGQQRSSSIKNIYVSLKDICPEPEDLPPSLPSRRKAPTPKKTIARTTRVSGTPTTRKKTTAPPPRRLLFRLLLALLLVLLVLVPVKLQPPG
ncbi:hypothetical protein D9758_012257 [Tetrapyrgos nigripes]|uniref:Uncharacterized protein n=1 Tax=Tetrapyrgos nigripes TaxID=182062 RepID=A0A8H5CH70_9AGAR|nr:hypothetical protein D9758_012257 [Tetrapyrgos nigripes]